MQKHNGTRRRTRRGCCADAAGKRGRRIERGAPLSQLCERSPRARWLSIAWTCGPVPSGTRVEDSSCRIAEAARSRAERTRAIATWRDVAVKRRTLRRAHRGEINGRVWRRALSKWGAWAQNRSMQRVLDWRAQTWRSNILARAALRVLLRFATRRSALLQRARDDWPECMRLLRTRYPHPLGGLLRRSFAPWRRKTAQLSWARRVALARQRVALLGVSIQLWHCRAELNRTARRMLGQWSSRAASRAMRLAETGPISVPRRGPTPEPHEAEHAMRRWRMHRALALIHAHAATRRVSRLCDATVARFRVTHVGHRALSTWRGAIIAQRSQAGGGVSEDAASLGPRGPGVAQSEGLSTDQGGSLSRLSQSEMARARSAAPYGQSLPFSRADGLEGRAAHASPQGEAGAVLVDQYMLESPTDAARADASSSRPTPTPRTRVTEADGAQQLRQHAEGIRANAAMPSALLLRTEVVAAQHAVPPPPVARGGVARSAMEESVVGGSVLGSSAAEPSRDAHASILDRATVSAARDAAGPAKAEPTTPPPPPPQSAFRQRSLPAAVPEQIEQRTPRRQSLPGAAPGQIAPSSGPTESATQQPAARAAPTVSGGGGEFGCWADEDGRGLLASTRGRHGQTDGKHHRDVESCRSDTRGGRGGAPRGGKPSRALKCRRRLAAGRHGGSTAVETDAARVRGTRHGGGPLALQWQAARSAGRAGGHKRRRRAAAANAGSRRVELTSASAVSPASVTAVVTAASVVRRRRRRRHHRQQPDHHHHRQNKRHVRARFFHLPSAATEPGTDSEGPSGPRRRPKTARAE